MQGQGNRNGVLKRKHGRRIRDVFPRDVTLCFTQTSVKNNKILALMEVFRQRNLHRDGFGKCLTIRKELMDVAQDLHVTVQTTVDQGFVKLDWVEAANAESRGALQCITGYLDTTARDGSGKSSSLTVETFTRMLLCFCCREKRRNISGWFKSQWFLIMGVGLKIQIITPSKISSKAILGFIRKKISRCLYKSRTARINGQFFNNPRLK